MKYVIGFDLAAVVVLVEVGAEVLHQQEVEDFHLMEEVEVLQVQMVQMVALEQAEQLDQVEVLGEVDLHLRELVVVEVLHQRSMELEVVVRLPVKLVGLVQVLELAWKQPHCDT